MFLVGCDEYLSEFAIDFMWVCLLIIVCEKKTLSFIEFTEMEERQTWFLDRPVCLANKCLSASLGYLREKEKAENDIRSHQNRIKIRALCTCRWD